MSLPCSNPSDEAMIHLSSNTLQLHDVYLLNPIVVISSSMDMIPANKSIVNRLFNDQISKNKNHRSSKLRDSREYAVILTREKFAMVVKFAEKKLGILERSDEEK